MIRSARSRADRTFSPLIALRTRSRSLGAFRMPVRRSAGTIAEMPVLGLILMDVSALRAAIPNAEVADARPAQLASAIFYVDLQPPRRRCGYSTELPRTESSYRFGWTPSPRSVFLSFLDSQSDKGCNRSDKDPQHRALLRASSLFRCGRTEVIARFIIKIEFKRRFLLEEKESAARYPQLAPVPWSSRGTYWGAFPQSSKAPECHSL